MSLPQLTTGDNTIRVTAMGAAVKTCVSYTDASAVAFGIENDGTLTTGANTITVTATRGAAESDLIDSTVTGTAVGMYSAENLLIAVGEQSIYTEAVTGTQHGVPEKAYAYALLTENFGTIILDPRGETVQQVAYQQEKSLPDLYFTAPRDSIHLVCLFSPSSILWDYSFDKSIRSVTHQKNDHRLHDHDQFLFLILKG